MSIVFKDIVLPFSLERSDVLIDGEIISKIGKNLSADTVIDGKNRLLSPGLFNAHTHSPMCLLRSYADGYPLEEWLFDKIFPIEDKLNDDDIYFAAQLSIMEMLASGTVCFADMYYGMASVAKAVTEVGIKANLSRGATGQGQEDQWKIDENVELFKEFNSDKIRVDFAPHSVYTCTPSYIEQIVKAAKSLGASLHVHLSETKTEQENCIKQYKKTPTELFEAAGVFEQKTIAAHCVHVTESDMDILLKNNISIAHNPTSNLKLASGIAPVNMFVEKGINVAIGTDGASSNNNLNMFEEMHLAAVLHLRDNPTAILPTEAFKMATKNGATAMGRRDTGEIKVGNKADLIVIDLDKPHLKPMHNAVSNLVYSAQGQDVYLTMVDGKILYQNGEFKTIDKEKVYKNIEKSKERLFV